MRLPGRLLPRVRLCQTGVTELENGIVPGSWDRVICHGQQLPMDVTSTPGLGSEAGRRSERGASRKNSNKKCMREPPRSQGAASKSLCRSPALLDALAGLSRQFSTQQARPAAVQAGRRGCCARWPQRSSTTGTAAALVLETVNTAGQRAVVSTDHGWSRRAGQGHRLRRA